MAIALARGAVAEYARRDSAERRWRGEDVVEENILMFGEE